jgi:hypothetical protein
LDERRSIEGDLDCLGPLLADCWVGHVYAPAQATPGRRDLDQWYRGVQDIEQPVAGMGPGRHVPTSTVGSVGRYPPAARVTVRADNQMGYKPVEASI